MSGIETKEQLLGELQRIEIWEKEQKDLWFWEKLGRLPFMLLDKFTPKKLKEKLGQAIDEMGVYVQSGGRYLISEQNVLDQLSQTNITAGGRPLFHMNDAANVPLQVMDETAERLASSRARFAAVQGATTGFGGIFTLAIDIPALLGLSLKVLQETALCYGYNPVEQKERVFVVKCLQFTSSDIVGKRAILEELSNFDRRAKGEQAVSQLQGWKEVIITYADNFGWKKLFQLVPIAGAIFGAYFNKSTMEDVAEAGTMLYRKRRILERLQQFDS